MADAATQDGGRDTDATATRSTDGAAFALAQPLPAALLYHRCAAADLPFALSSELEEVPGLIGQERAVEAISLAMRMRGKGYNVYALGPSGTARLVLCQQFCRSAKAAPAAPTGRSRCRARRGNEAPRRGTARRPAGGVRARRIPGATCNDRTGIQGTARTGFRCFASARRQKRYRPVAHHDRVGAGARPRRQGLVAGAVRGASAGRTRTYPA